MHNEYSNVFNISLAKEEQRKVESAEYQKFREQVTSDQSLYCHSGTYFIRMKYGRDDVKAAYNIIKNELLSYADKDDRDNRVQCYLSEDVEFFTIGNVIAKLHVVGGLLSLYLALDPTKYNTKNGIHKDVSKYKEHENTPCLIKLSKEGRVKKAIEMIADAMQEAGCEKVPALAQIDYASFYSRIAVVVRRAVDEEIEEEDKAFVPLFGESSERTKEADSFAIEGAFQETVEENEDHINEGEGKDPSETVTVFIDDISDIRPGEVLDIVERPEIGEVLDESDNTASKTLEEGASSYEEERFTEESEEEEEDVKEEEPDAPVYIYENVAAPSSRPIFRDINDKSRRLEDEVRPPVRKTIFDSTGEEEEKRIQRAKEAAKATNSIKRTWDELSDYGYHFVPLKQLIFYAIAVIVAIGLSVLFKLDLPFAAIVVLSAIFIMPGILANYYKNKYEEKRYRDAETYIEQMLYSFRRNSKITASLADALVVFPSGYMHDKIVEAMDYIRSSGDEASVYTNALEIIENAFPCRRIKSLHRYMIKVEGVGGEHDAGIAALLKDRRLWIDRTDAFRKQCSATIKEIILATIFSTAMTCVILYMLPSDLFNIADNMVYQIVSTICIVVNFIIIRLTFKVTVISLNDLDIEEHERMAHKLEWLRNYDDKKEAKHTLVIALAIGVLALVAILSKQYLVAVVAGVVVLYVLFLHRKVTYENTKKSIAREVEKVYPDWLLELALLLQTDNMHVAIEKTLPSAPAVLKKDLEQLSDDLITHPNDLTPYASFFSFLSLPSVHSSMKLLYSIAEFGATDESLQLSELVERNNTLMDRAERMKNDDKVAIIFLIKFLPTLMCSLKMMVDLFVFLLGYMAIMM